MDSSCTLFRAKQTSCTCFCFCIFESQGPPTCKQDPEVSIRPRLHLETLFLHEGMLRFSPTVFPKFPLGRTSSPSLLECERDVGATLTFGSWLGMWTGCDSSVPHTIMAPEIGLVAHTAHPEHRALVLGFWL
jgi:hypothetical protein